MFWMRTRLGPPHLRAPKPESAQVWATWQVESRKKRTWAPGHPGWAQWGLPFQLMGWKLDPESQLTV